MMPVTLNKVLVEHPLYSEANRRVEDIVRRTEAGEQHILLMCGPSRVGKNYAIWPVQQRFDPKVAGDGRRERPWLYVKIAQTPSLSTLPRAILIATGMTPWAVRRGGPEPLMAAAVDAIQRLRVRVLVIDEFHHFSEKGARAAALDAANSVKNFVDLTGVTCIMPGLPTMLGLLNRDEQLRARAQAPFHFLPYAWAIKHQRADFAEAIRTLLRELESAGMELSLDADFVFRAYVATAGRIGVFVKLMNEACDLARESRRINMATMRRAHGNAIRHDSDGPNPFADCPAEEQAMAALVKLLRESGYSAEFIDRSLHLQGVSAAAMRKVSRTQRNVAIETMQEAFAC